MITHYIIKEINSNCMVGGGKYQNWTFSLSNAKHFSSEWSAEQFRQKLHDPELYKVIKIVHQ